MLTLLEFCEKFRISQPKARKMLKAGALLVSDMPDAATVKIAETLAQRNPLSASDLCTLLESPGMILQLGRYVERAQDQVEAVGDAMGSQAPREVSLAVADAARGDPDSVQVLVDWLKRALPASGEVGHAWIACRLLLALPANIREFENQKVVRALAWCRKSDSFAGWWTYSKIHGRKVSIYARPNPLASFDL